MSERLCDLPARLEGPTEAVAWVHVAVGSECALVAVGCGVG